MILSDYAVRHPAVITILLVVLLVAGVLAFSALNREMVPPTGLPQANVITRWPGASAREVEEAITRRLENRLSNLSDLSTMTSTSRDSYSVIQLEFRDGVDIYGRLPEIRELLNVVEPDLPGEISGSPEILVYEANSLLPIFSIQVESSMNPVALTEYLDDELAPRMARVPGVAQILIRGAAHEEARVMVDLERLAARDITPLEVLYLLSVGNVNFPAGQVEYVGQELALTAEGAFTDLQDIRSLVVGNHEGALVRLGDVATVERRIADREIRIRSNQRDVMVVDVFKRDDGNTLRIVDAVEGILADMDSEHPGAISWHIVADQREMTQQSIATVIGSAVAGIVLATAVILLFLRNGRATAIIAVSIPLSMLFALAAMFAGGQTINLLTLSGITVAVGMIVDASIVSLENVWRHRATGSDAPRAAREGTGEVAPAILASTLTSVGVFAPLIFLTGVIGIIMRDLSLTIVYSLAAAAVVAVVVVPFLASLLLPGGAPVRHGRVDRLFSRVERGYRALLSHALANKPFVLFTATVILVISVLFLTVLPVSFLPATDTGEFEIHLETPRTFSLDRTVEVVDAIDQIVRREVPEVEAMVFYGGSTNAMAITGTPNRAFGRVRLVPTAERRRTVQEIIPAVQRVLDAHVPHGEITVLNGGFDALLGLATGGQGYQLEIYGTRLEDVAAVAETVRDYLSRDPDVRRAETTIRLDGETLFVALSRDDMGGLGINARDAGTTLRIIFNGVEAGSFSREDDRIPIRVVSPLADEPFDGDAVQRVSLRNAAGRPVSFAAFSEVESRPTISMITKRDRAISATVRGYLVSEDQSGVAQRTEAAINSLDLPPGVRWQRAGTSELIVTSMRQLGAALALAVFLVYVVMVIQFERFMQPLVIMAAVPFCLIGVVMGLLIFRSTLSIIAMLGLITLGGIVVNNAIVMVDRVNALRKGSDLSVRDALVAGAGDRLRPVLMTTLTTILAVLPMALAAGDGSEVYAPLGQAIFGGLLTSTAITLFVVPVLYDLLETRGKKPGRGTRGVPAGPSTGVVVGVLVFLFAGFTGADAQNADAAEQIAMHRRALVAALETDELFSWGGAPGAGPGAAPSPYLSYPADSPEMRRGERDYRIAEAQLREARAERMPRVSTRVEGSWLMNPPDSISLAAGEFGEIPPLAPGTSPTPLPNQDVELLEGGGWLRYEVGLKVEQPIYLSGRIARAVEAREAARRLAGIQRDGVRHGTEVEVAALLDTLAVLRAMENLLAIQDATARRLVDITRESWQNGFITETVYLQARLTQREVVQALAEVAEERENARGKLLVLTGLSALPDEAEYLALPVAARVPDSEEDLIRQLVQGSWELRVLEEAQRGAAAAVAIAGSDGPWRPEIGMSAGVSVSGFLDRGDLDWQGWVGVGISTDLFDGRRSAARQEIAREEAARTTVERRGREEEQIVELRTILRRLETLQSRMDLSLAVVAVRHQEERDVRTARQVGAAGEREELEAVLRTASATLDGYRHLIAYRAELWRLAGLLGR